MFSRVEEVALSSSSFKAQYPAVEKMPVIVVDNFPDLGKLTALRFIEWVQNNPEGVVSLPTGKTPEYFIKWTKHLLNHWAKPETRELIENAGVDPEHEPDLGNLHFVQIDEFYPISPDHDHSFYSYVQEFYIDGLGLNPDRALTINCAEIGLPDELGLEDVWPEGRVDLSLRFRAPKNKKEEMQREVLYNVDQWCQDYEKRIRTLGGIGFFLGGIGPDGHIAFNVRGADHNSTTRLTAINYETESAAAGDLGGMQLARGRRVITIGLGTICFNPSCDAIIVAAGEAKSNVVADAVQMKKDVRYPATALHKLENARFYVTRGACKALRERQCVSVASRKRISDDKVEEVFVDLAVEHNKRVLDITEDDVKGDRLAMEVAARREEPLAELLTQVHKSLIAKIERGTRTLSDTVFLHTEPHHDDLMLGYLPYIVRHVRDSSNHHHFASMTSGFTAVTDFFLRKQLEILGRWIDTAEFRSMFEEGYFDPDNITGCHRDVWEYLDGVAANLDIKRSQGVARRFLRNLIGVYDIDSFGGVREKIVELENYLDRHRPGEKDARDVQKLKGMCREWEAECLWGYFGCDSNDISNHRLAFYTGAVFTEEPTKERDVLPVYDLLSRVAPDVVSVALDPEASGPDTHYKVLQVVAESLRHYSGEEGRHDVRVWGYRNVWYKFHPSEANAYVPVSLNMFSIMRDAFMNAFISQKDAPFPSFEWDGPFCELARKNQVEQYQEIKTCLGREWFHKHKSPLIRATRGLVFLRDMNLEEFYRWSRKLRKAAENR